MKTKGQKNWQPCLQGLQLEYLISRYHPSPESNIRPALVPGTVQFSVEAIQSGGWWNGISINWMSSKTIRYHSCRFCDICDKWLLIIIVCNSINFLSLQWLILSFRTLVTLPSLSIYRTEVSNACTCMNYMWVSQITTSFSPLNGTLSHYPSWNA